MDTTVTRKRPNVIRANAEQTKILNSAFVVSTTPTTSHIKALSEETGLPHKWIVSWFSRQRRKINTRDAGGAPSSDLGLSPDQIMDFKTEYTDPLVTTENTASTTDNAAQERTTNSKLKKKKKTEGPPRKKVKTETAAEAQAIPPQESHALHALPLLGVDFSLPPPAPDASIETLLRTLAPSVFMHSTPNASSSSIANHTRQNPLGLHYKYDTKSCKPESVATSPLQPLVPIAQQRAFTPIRGPGSTRIPFQPALHVNSDTQSRFPHTEGPCNDLQTSQARRYVHHSSSRGPTQEPPAHHSPHVLFTRSGKENHRPSINLLLNPQREKPALPESHLTVINNQTAPTEYRDPFHYIPDLSPLDPATTPLKHLTLFEPLETLRATGGILEREDTIKRLLDKRLAQEDPFQAAMGLVFLSRLGLGWDYQ